MKTLEFIYNEETINFESTSDDSVMVNATQMANVFGKRVDHFLKSDHAKAFIEALLSTPNGVDKPNFKKEDIIAANKKGGTWMHRILALKFAAWLDPYFEVWVFQTLDQILFGHYKAIQTATIEKIKAEQALEAKKKELLESNPDFEEFLELEGKLSAEDKKRLKAIKESLKQTRMDFD